MSLGRAAGAAAAIRRSIGTNELMRLTEILTKDSTITMKVDVDREGFALLDFPVDQGK